MMGPVTVTAEHRERAKAMVQHQLEHHADGGVRAIAAIVEPPPEAVERIAIAIAGKERLQ